MARRSATSTSDTATATSKPKALGILTLLLTLYAAGVSTLLLARGGGGDGAGAGKPTGTGTFDPDRIARDVQLAVQADLKRATTEQKELLGRRHAAAWTRSRRTSRQLTDAAIKRTESGLAHVVGARRGARRPDQRPGAGDRRPEDDARRARRAGQGGRVASGRGASRSRGSDAREAARRPDAAARRSPSPRPTGPSPEEIAANKEKVKAAIADLASPDIGKVFAACLLLQSLKDLEAVEPLLKVLREYKDPYGRTAAATALGNLHACDGVPGLIGAFLDKDPGVFLAAGQAFFKITAQDSGLSGDASRKDKTEAKEKWTRWWKDHEAEIAGALEAAQGRTRPAGDPPK